MNGRRLWSCLFLISAPVYRQEHPTLAEKKISCTFWARLTNAYKENKNFVSSSLQYKTISSFAAQEKWKAITTAETLPWNNHRDDHYHSKAQRLTWIHCLPLKFIAPDPHHRWDHLNDYLRENSPQTRIVTVAFMKLPWLLTTVPPLFHKESSMTMWSFNYRPIIRSFVLLLLGNHCLSTCNYLFITLCMSACLIILDGFELEMGP